MYLIGQDPSLHRGIFIHDRPHIFGAGVEDAHARYLAPIGDGTDNREHSLRTEREISAPMLPDSAVGSPIMPVRSDLQDNEGVVSSGGQHLAHVIVGNCRHEWLPPVAVFFPPLQAWKCETVAVEQSLKLTSPCQTVMPML